LRGWGAGRALGCASLWPESGESAKHSPIEAADRHTSTIDVVPDERYSCCSGREVCDYRRCTRGEMRRPDKKKKVKSEKEKRQSLQDQNLDLAALYQLLCVLLNLLLFLHLGRCGVRTVPSGVRGPENETTPQGS